jgi:hypothetical protein
MLVASDLRSEWVLYIFKNFVNHSVPAIFLSLQSSRIYIFNAAAYSNENFLTSLADKP